jgi:hypothetical protein
MNWLARVSILRPRIARQRPPFVACAKSLSPLDSWVPSITVVAEPTPDPTHRHLCHPLRPRLRQLPQRLHLTPAPSRVNRPPALPLPPLRRAHRRRRQHPHPQLDSSPRPLPPLPSTNRMAIPSSRARHSRALPAQLPQTRPHRHRHGHGRPQLFTARPRRHGR